jgi:hypothetical protein
MREHLNESEAYLKATTIILADSWSGDAISTDFS